MTKKHFIFAASQVRNILEGRWTFDPPNWADRTRFDTSFAMWDADAEKRACYTRAVQTAEAYIELFTRENPRFDTDRFLTACGLS